MPLDPSQEDFKYWAFISYSHSDDKWAEWLHKGLETYKVPPHLVGKPSREGIVPARPFPVFRDRDELPGSANLGDNIEAALRLSRYLIVICSPNSVASKWVDKEIRMFKSWGREDRVLCLIVEGEPNASAHPGHGLPECLPDAVKFWVDQNGRVTEIPTEPIAADARKGKDGKKNALLKLLAGILGVNFDDLKQRDYERQERRRKVALAATFSLLVVFSGLGVGFYFQKNAAIDARIAAENERIIAERARETAEARAKEAEDARSKEETARLDEKAARERAEAAAEAERVARRDAVEAQKKAEQAREIAVIERKRAREKEIEVRRTLSVSDLTAAGRLIEQNEEGKALAYLARALRYDSDNAAVVSRAISLLSQRNWPMPLIEPLRHEAEVKGGVFSPDGKLYVTVADAALNVWHRQTGKLAYEPIRHGKRINSVTFSQDGKRLLTASYDGTAQLWDSATGKPASEAMKHDGWVLEAVFSPDGKLIATASQDKSARIWDAATGKPVTAPLRHPGPVGLVRFAPNQRTILTASQNVARLWTIAKGETIGVAMTHEGGIAAAEFSPDGTIIATGAGDKTARLWDGTTGVAVGKVMQHDGWVLQISFSPEGKRLLIACGDGTARIWNVATGAPGVVVKHEGPVNSARFSPNGRWFVTSSADQTSRVWDSSTGQSVAEPLRHAKMVNDACFTPDGRCVATVSDDATAKLWSITDGRPKTEAFRHEQQVNATVFSPDGKYLATASADRTARIWDAATGKPVTDSLRHKKAVTTVAFSPDGKLLATGSEDLTVQIWDVATGKAMLTEPMEHERPANTLEFSPDGRLLLTASDDRRARVWEVATGALQFEPLKHDGAVRRAAFSADGKLIVTACSDGKARVWATATGQLITSVAHPSEIITVALSPDNKWLVTGSEDKTARVWDAATGNPVTAPIVHDSAVNVVAFTPAAAWDDKERPKRWILTATEKALRLWEADSGKAVTEPMNHPEPVRTASFSADGSFVVSAFGKVARVWDSSGKPVADGFEHEGLVRSATFSPDGKFVATSSTANAARIWFFTLPGQAPGWLSEFVSAVGGFNLDNFGAADPVEDSWERIVALRKDLETTPGSFRDWANWFIAPRLDRSVAAFVSVPVEDYVRSRLLSGTPGALNAVLDIQPDNALGLAQLARLSQDSAEADFLSRLAEQYQPNDPQVLWHRAIILQQASRNTEALAIMERAIRLDPRNVTMLRPDGAQFSLTYADGRTSTGWLPHGWIDFNTVPLLNVAYARVPDGPGGMLAWEIKSNGEARGQTETRGPHFLCKKNARCTVEGWVRSASKSDLNVIVSQFIDPYQKYKEQIVRTTPEWKPFRIQFAPTQDIAAEIRLLTGSGAAVQVAGVSVSVE